MSLEDDAEISSNFAPGTSNQSQKQSKISYTREFLLSLSGLDACKKLPGGFDQSILSEFEDSSHLQDRQRIHGNLPLQGYRRNDYGSSPPTKGGKWESRSSSWSDKDSDTQSDRDSDHGRHVVHLSRRPWQNSEHEHDGLLGSGSFPRPSPGLSTAKVPSNDSYRLNRSNEPYHPPRPYKAVPHSRRDMNDSYNDETFGSTEFTSQDKMEEERRRRASFELMRKEQQQALHEKQKLNQEKRKEVSVSDANVLMEEMKENGLLDRHHVLDVTATQHVSENDSASSSLLSQASMPRPLVPPGFRSTVLEKNSAGNILSIPDPREALKPDIEENVQHVKINTADNGSCHSQREQHLTDGMGLIEQQAEDKSSHATCFSKSEYMGDILSCVDASCKTTGMNDDSHRTSVPEAHETLDGNIFGSNAKNVDEYNSVGSSNRETSTSILDKLFGNVASVSSETTSGLVKHHDGQLDEMWNSNTINSSKFAQWFDDEGHAERSSANDDLSSYKPSDLLSIILSSEKTGFQVSDTKTDTDYLSENCERANDPVRCSLPVNTTGMSRQMYNSNGQQAVPAILTCEDLEQTILSEYNQNSSNLEPSVLELSVSGKETEEQSKANVDDRASQHLLSLLQKGTEIDLKGKAPSSSLVTENLDQLHIFGVDNAESMFKKPSEVDNVKDNLGKSLTLETLFGTAFMKELKSVEAPVSAQRNLDESAKAENFEPHSLPFSNENGNCFADSEFRSGRKSYETSVLSCSERRKTNSGKFENWLDFDDPHIKKDEASRHVGFDGGRDIQLPEEDNLITIGDPVKLLSSASVPVGNSALSELLASRTLTGAIDNKLAAFREQIVRDQDGLSFVADHYGIESRIPHRNLHSQTSLPQFNPQQQFRTMDPYSRHISSHMFKAPDSTMQHDYLTNQQYVANRLNPPFNHHGAGMTGLDNPTQHPLLRQMQMHMPSNFIMSHPPGEVPRAPQLLHHGTQQTNFIHEMNQIHRFPFDARQPSVNGLGMPLPAPDVNGRVNHPEVFQRLVEMESRTNSKQVHPFVGNQSREMHGHQLDMGFRYL